MSALPVVCAGESFDRVFPALQRASMISCRLGGLRAASWVVALVLGWVAAVSSHAANSLFLEIEGIPGESVNAAHAGKIDLLAFSWGLANAGTAGGPTSEASVQEFSFTKRTDKTSPKLMLRVFNGAPIPTVTLYLRSSSASFDYMKIVLRDVVVASYNVSSSDGDDGPQESFSMRFAEIDVEYTPTRPNGTADPIKSTMSWNVAENRAN
jgi:type VI secretion system secreted protein Hcp